MCYERRSRWMREQSREEGRRFWDLFDRETRDDPPQPVAEPPRREDPDPVAADQDREPVVTRA
jgi:hypothetical protein